MLVILEGLDNTGKTTIAKMLMQYYKIQGKNAILAKGFNVTDINKEFCLTYGEVSEAYEAWRKKKEDLGEELADVVIYLLGLSEILKIDLEDEILKKVYKNSKR